ncbi:hypothetical protein ACFE04_022352 [Oxalis oulophora]
MNQERAINIRIKKRTIENRRQLFAEDPDAKTSGGSGDGLSNEIDIYFTDKVLNEWVCRGYDSIVFDLCMGFVSAALQMLKPKYLTGKLNMTHYVQQLGGLCPLNAIEMVSLGAKNPPEPKQGISFFGIVRDFPHGSLTTMKNIMFLLKKESFLLEVVISCDDDRIKLEKEVQIIATQGETPLHMASKKGCNEGSRRRVAHRVVLVAKSKCGENQKRIVCVTSGGTIVPLEEQCVRCIDNFSSGHRGTTSTKSQDWPDFICWLFADPLCLWFGVVDISGTRPSIGWTGILEWIKPWFNSNSVSKIRKNAIKNGADVAEAVDDAMKKTMDTAWSAGKQATKTGKVRRTFARLRFGKVKASPGS